MVRSGEHLARGSATRAEGFVGHPLESLLRLEVFRGISAPRLKRLIEGAYFTGLPRGEEVRFEGEDAGLFYVLLQGVTKTTLVDELQRPLLVTVHGAGSLFGGRALLAPLIVHGYDCIAIRSCVIASFDPKEFLDARFGVPGRKFGTLMHITLLRVCDQILRFSKRAGLTAHQRLAFALVELGASFGARDARGTLLTLLVTHDLLGEIVGASRQRVTVNLNELARRGALKREKRKLILNIPELNRIAARGLGSTRFDFQ